MEGAVKTLTIRQPWAWAIMAGYKTIENRTWRTSYRGPLLIHAATQYATDDGRAERVFSILGITPPTLLVRGCVIGCVELVDIIPVSSVSADPWAFGPWCWVLESPRSFEIPIPLKGRPGLFEFAI